MYYRLTMPYMEVAKHDGYETFLSGTFSQAGTIRPTSTGALECMDLKGEWRLPDVIVFQRFMHRDAAQLFERAMSDSQVIINDCDDQFWNLPKSNIAYHSTHPDTHPDFNRDHYRRAIAASSAITVTTPEMARELERLGPPVFLCRNSIDLDRWYPHDPGVNGSCGWIGGVAWRAHDLDVLRPVLPDFLSDFDISFYHGGNSQDPSVKRAWDLIGIDPEKIKCISADLCPIWEYPKLFEPLNISLIPLEDHRFNWAKSALKALESSAAGIPYIASDLPEQRWFTEDGGMGRLAKNWKPQTWRRHLDELLDPDVRREEGAANRKHAEQWNIVDKWTQWRDVLDAVGPRTGVIESRRAQQEQLINANTEKDLALQI
jgi:glycosyltransferase involved in cell wall biosynthesis